MSYHRVVRASVPSRCVRVDIDATVGKASLYFLGQGVGVMRTADLVDQKKLVS